MNVGRELREGKKIRMEREREALGGNKRHGKKETDKQNKHQAGPPSRGAGQGQKEGEGREGECQGLAKAPEVGPSVASSLTRDTQPKSHLGTPLASRRLVSRPYPELLNIDFIKSFYI